ncbi:MAG: response regulator [Myxococcales bacterium]|nr:response regulator [Myxococcales bacterium]
MANVLIVDDSISMRKLVQGTLVEAGHCVVEAEDGVDGLAKAKQSPIDLVITDINMPNMDGLELLGELRKLSDFKFTPILVLTTEMDPEKKKIAKERGATGWLVKPFNPDQLISTIKKVLD